MQGPYHMIQLCNGGGGHGPPNGVGPCPPNVSRRTEQMMNFVAADPGRDSM